MIKDLIHAVGKRKTSIARIWMRPGKGRITINKQDIDDYYNRPTSKMLIRQPLVLTEMKDQVDIHINVRGGGLSGQAGAIRQGISRALLFVDSEFRIPLKKEGLLTRDSRRVERKLPGQPKARKNFQYSKR